MTAGQEPVLTVEAISAGYGGIRIIEDVSISLYAGEIVTIIGPNGAGKSTLLKAICGLAATYAGAVSLSGHDVTGEKTDRLCKLGVAFVPQTNNVFATMTVRENLEMGAYLYAGDIDRRIDWITSLFPVLETRLGVRAGRLSGGQRQMVAIARALMLEPAILLLDEPSASLAPNMVDQVFDKIVDINQDGIPVLIVEQNARRALSISDRGYVLAGGSNRFEGPAQSLLDTEEVRRLYLGG